MSRKVGIIVLVALFSFTLTAFAGDVADPAWWKQAAEPYQGITIRGVSEGTPPSKAISDIAGKDFEELTGIKVELEVTSWDEMYTKEMNDIQAGSGIYDFIYIEQDIIYSYLQNEWLMNLSKMMADNPALVYGQFDLDDFTSFINYFKDANGDIFGIPFEAFIKTYVYRTDLFEDPEIQAAFKEKYGRDLAPPKYWKEYDDIAMFFTDWAKEKGMELYGHNTQAKSHPALAYELEETIWPAWGIWTWGINLDNWKATSANGGTLDSERAKETLAWFVDMLQYASPAVRTYTWDEAAGAMASGTVVQSTFYGENTTWVATDETRSKVVGKLGVALPPVYDDQVMEDIQAGKGYIGYYDGGALGIPVSAKNKEAALLFLQFVARKEWAPEFASLAGRVVRKSTFDSEKIKALDPKVGGYFSLLRDYGHLFAGAPAFPMHPILNEIQLKWVEKAVVGDVTPEQACDEMAKELDAKLEELGY